MHTAQIRRPRSGPRLAASLLVAIFAAAAFALFAAPPARAQECVSCAEDGGGPAPTPTPAGTPAPSGTPAGPDAPPLADSLARIAANSRLFLEELSGSILESFRGPITWVAAALGAILIGITMTQMPWSSDTGIKLLFCLLRISIFCGLFFMVTPLFARFDQLIATDGSTTIDEGQDPFDAQGRIVLNMGDKVRMARTEFDHQYWVFTSTYFKDGQPSGTTTDSVGRLWDMSKPWYQNVDRVLSPNDWGPSQMFSFITIARGLLALTELAAGMLWAFVKLALFLFAPVALAAGINDKMAQRITYPYLNGLVVFYFIWPPVADVIRLASYKACTMTLQSFMKPVVTHGLTQLGNPVDYTHVGTIDAYAVMAGIAIMLVCTLMQFGSPFLAYKFWNGQIFEAVTSQTSSWIATVTGTVAEAYGAKVAADLDNAARALEIRGNYESTVVRADHQREAAQLGAQANKRMGEASADSQRISGRASAEAGRVQGLMSNQATRDLNVNLATTQTGQGVAQNEISRAQQLGMTLVNRDQRVGELDNRKNWGMADTAVGTTAGVVKEVGGGFAGNGIGGGLVKGSATAGEGVYRGAVSIPGQYEGLKGIQRGAADKSQKLTNEYADATRDNLKTGLQGGTTLTGEQVVGQVPAWEQFKSQSDAATQAGYEKTMGGVEGSYRATMGGIHDAYGLNVKAADTVYQGDTRAAEVMRGASTQAADMHRVASIIQQVSRDFDRKLEQAITVRL